MQASKAAARVHYLNGGNPAHDELVAALRSARKNFWIVREYAKGVDVQHAIEEIDTALAKAGA